MSMRCGWFAFDLVVLLILAASPIQNAGAYSYVASGPYLPTDMEKTENSESQTHSSEASVSADAYDYGYVTVDAATYAKAQDGDSAWPSASAYAGWQKHWQWDGPPGTAPGGTLDWYATAGGYSFCHGDTYPGVSGGAMSVADAGATGGAGGSGGAGDNGAHGVFGYVEDGSWAYADYYSYGPDGGWYDGDYYEDYGEYAAQASWNFDIGDYTSIPSGTSYVNYSTGVTCDTYSAVGAGPEESGAVAHAWTGVDAHVSGVGAFP